MVRHALRDALIPSITVPAQDFGFLIIVAVETVFAYPGLGRMRSDRCRLLRPSAALCHATGNAMPSSRSHTCT